MLTVLRIIALLTMSITELRLSRTEPKKRFNIDDYCIKKKNIFHNLKYKRFNELVRLFKNINSINNIDNFIKLRLLLIEFEQMLNKNNYFVNEWNTLDMVLKEKYSAYYIPTIPLAFSTKINETVVDIITFNYFYKYWNQRNSSIIWPAFYWQFYNNIHNFDIMFGEAGTVNCDIICRELYELCYPKKFVLEVVKHFGIINVNFVQVFALWYTEKIRRAGFMY